MIQPFQLFGREQSARKNFVNGTHRCVSPQETLARFQPLMAQFGITRIANITGLDTIKLPTYSAIRPNSRSIAVSQGKGLEATAAKASALMEAIEGWHAENLDVPLRYDSYSSMKTQHSVVDATKLVLTGKRPFLPNFPILWTLGESLIRHAPVWLPYETVMGNMLFPPGFEPIFYAGSNGLASGNHLLEATVHGLCEVIERDADALWLETADARPIDAQTIDDPACCEALSLLRAADVEAAIWDITSDVGVPAYTCVVIEPPARRSGRGVGYYHGFGCHLDPGIALLRAITESVQSRLTLISGAREGEDYEKYASLQAEAFLDGLWDEIEEGRKNALSSGLRRKLATSTFEDDLRLLLDMVSKAGVDEVVAVNLSKPEFGIPVVKVIVPGLEGPADINCPIGPRAQSVRDRRGCQ